MRVTFVTEGTYPTADGGVSVWCDQLIRGLPEHHFDVHAIVASGSEPTKWPRQHNIDGVHLIPLWGSDPPGHHGTARRGDARHSLADARDALFDVLFQPGPDDIAAFLRALAMLRPLAISGVLTGALRSPQAIDDLLDRWSVLPIPGRQARPTDRVARATVDDAVRASALLDHFLRPLGVQVPRADLCHAVSNGLSSLVALGAHWDHGTPFLLTEHGVYLREQHLAFRKGEASFAVRALILRFITLLTAAAYRTADLISPGSDYNGRWQMHWGAAPGRIHRVHNGVDPAEFPEGAEPDTPTLSWLGRITAIKDLELLISAFRLVTDRMPGVRLRLFGTAPPGDEDYRDQCRTLIESLDLSGQVTFEGRVAAPVDAYHAGTVVVLSSRSEGFPYSLIEAMATGRATVSTDVGGVKEAVGEAGIVVPPGDPRALAEGCLRLLADVRLRDDLARRARARVLGQFTVQHSLTAYRELYQQLAPAPS